MKVAVIGSRTLIKFPLQKVLAELPCETTELVSGGAIGADQLAVRAAAALGLPLREFLPDYKAHGHIAPLLRNKQIADYADLVIAIWDMRSRGTANTLAYCLKIGKPVRILNPAEPA